LYRSQALDLVSCIGNATHRDPYVMEWSLFEVHFQDDGGYLLGDGERTLVVDPNHVEIRWAGSSAIYSRPPVSADRGTSARLPVGLARRLLPGAERPASGCLVRPLPGRLFQEWRTIRRLLAAGVSRGAGPAVEERTIAILAAILRADPPESRVPARHVNLVERVKEVLLVHSASPIRRIEAGADNFSSLALGLGFSSHSHLTTAFRARFGCSPARYRSAAGLTEP
jgi:AraC-like DNA-binding protein